MSEDELAPANKKQKIQTEEELKRYIMQELTNEQKAAQLIAIPDKLEKASAKTKLVPAEIGYQKQPVSETDIWQNSNTNKVQATNSSTNDWTNYSASIANEYQSPVLRTHTTQRNLNTAISQEITEKKTDQVTRNKEIMAFVEKYKSCIPAPENFNSFFKSQKNLPPYLIKNDRANLNGCTLGRFDDSNPNDIKLELVNFSNMDLTKVNLKNATLVADFSDTILYKTRLDETTITYSRGLNSEQLFYAKFKHLYAEKPSELKNIINEADKLKKDFKAEMKLFIELVRNKNIGLSNQELLNNFLPANLEAVKRARDLLVNHVEQLDIIIEKNNFGHIKCLKID